MWLFVVCIPPYFKKKNNSTVSIRYQIPYQKRQNISLVHIGVIFLDVVITILLSNIVQSMIVFPLSNPHKSLPSHPIPSQCKVKIIGFKSNCLLCIPKWKLVNKLRTRKNCEKISFFPVVCRHVPDDTPNMQQKSIKREKWIGMDWGLDNSYRSCQRKRPVRNKCGDAMTELGQNAKIKVEVSHRYQVSEI